MKVSAEEIGWTPNVTFGQYNFERVTHFNYLGTLLNCKNTMTEEINKRIMAGNRTYYANMKLLYQLCCQDIPNLSYTRH
jgi:hypothetical protein